MNMKLSLHGAAFAGLVFSAAACAGDAKVYPGSACLPVNNSQSYSLAFQSFTNTASTEQWVYCPVIRDNLDSRRLLGNTYVTVRDSDPAGGVGDVYCSLRMIDVVGGSLAITYAYSPTGAANTSQLVLGPLEAAVPSSYFILCRLPPSAGANQSRIISYHVDEPD